MTCPSCGSSFVKNRPWQIYCCETCRNNSVKKREATNVFQKKRREWLNSIKMENGCVVCGYKEHPAALDFNHVTGEKKFNLSQDPKRAMSDLLKELEKCEVLCSNCHRVKTYEEKHWHTKRKSSETL